MLCPKENCIWDSFPKTGEHVCTFGTCKYNAARELTSKPSLLLKQEDSLGKDKTCLNELNQLYDKAFESG